MAQFDVYRLANGQRVLLVLIGIVAPLREAARNAGLPGLTPQVEVEGQAWIVRLPELAAIPGAELRDPIASLVIERDSLKRALDFLIDGV